MKMIRKRFAVPSLYCQTQRLYYVCDPNATLILINGNSIEGISPGATWRSMGQMITNDDAEADAELVQGCWTYPCWLSNSMNAWRHDDSSTGDVFDDKPVVSFWNTCPQEANFIE